MDAFEQWWNEESEGIHQAEQIARAAYEAGRRAGVEHSAGLLELAVDDGLCDMTFREFGQWVTARIRGLATETKP
jgi:protein-disulfide isomerase-like protein with CxxC motif